MTENQKLREALQRIQYKAKSLADAQVIALEALALPTADHIPDAGVADAQDVRLTDEQRKQVFRDAENRMMRDINLSWRNAVVDEVERVINAASAKGQS